VRLVHRAVKMFEARKGSSEQARTRMTEVQTRCAQRVAEP